MKDSSKTFLKGYDSETNAFLIRDYPYGRLRCLKKVWIETDKKGNQRTANQTQNPKTLKWNKPKKSTYSDMIFLYIDHNEKDYLKPFHISLNVGYTKLKATHQYLIDNEIELNDHQKRSFFTSYINNSIISYNWNYQSYKQETQKEYYKSIISNIERMKLRKNDFINLFTDIQPLTVPDIAKEDRNPYFRSNGTFDLLTGIQITPPDPAPANEIKPLTSEERRQIMDETAQEFKNFVIQPQEEEQEEKPFLNPSPPDNMETEQLNIFEAPSQAPAPTPQEKFINDHFIISGFSPAQTEEIKTGIKDRINN